MQQPLLLRDDTLIRKLIRTNKRRTMESENLQLEDGLYTVDVQLEGGSGS